MGAPTRFRRSARRSRLDIDTDRHSRAHALHPVASLADVKASKGILRPIHPGLARIVRHFDRSNPNADTVVLTFQQLVRGAGSWRNSHVRFWIPTCAMSVAPRG